MSEEQPAAVAPAAEEPAAPAAEEPTAPAAEEPTAPAAEEPAAPAPAAAEPEVSKDAQIIFVLGGPGSGKGTQCEQIVKKYGFGHFSAGDLLRAEVASGSDMGKELEEIMKEGKLVPSSVTIQLLKKAIANAEGEKFLVDGFPRALDQAEEFEKEVIPCKLVLFFDCPQDVMQERLLKRAETSGRADDNIETIKKRFDTFMNASMPVIDHFEKVEKVAKISAVPAPEEVFVEVCKVMESHGFMDAEAEAAELEAAAIKLQSSGRAMLARKKVEKAKKEKAKAEAEAEAAPAAEEPAAPAPVDEPAAPAPAAAAPAPAEPAAPESAAPAQPQVMSIGGGETTKEYLEKIEVVANLKLSLKQLDIARSDSPYRFLANYFTNIAEQRGEAAL